MLPHDMSTIYDLPEEVGGAMVSGAALMTPAVACEVANKHAPFMFGLNAHINNIIAENHVA